jgi:branched-chain amino acid transport system substrate-binding protein
MTRHRQGFASALVALALVVSAMAVQEAGAASSDAPGVTAKDITIGYIWSGTGVAASTTADAGKAFQARIDRQNAAGGVNGRKIKAVLIDDKSSGANLTAAKDLVENSHAFMVVNNSSLAFLTYRYLLDAGVPMIGGGYDSNYYGQPGNENIISALATPFVGITNDSTARIMKKLGGTKVATLSYSVSPSSVASAQALQKYAVPALGMKSVYDNSTVEFGTQDVGPLVLGIQNSGADAAYLPLVATSNVAIIQGLQQNGVKMKALVMPTGYGQDLLDQPVAKTLGPEDVFTSAWAPVELQTKATKQMQSDLKKYSGLTGVPNFGTYTGYITAELAVLGLEHAGKNPSRQSFVDGLHSLGTYDAAGLSCSPINISAENYGKFPTDACTYAVTVKNGKFVVSNGGKPIKAKLVGDPDLLASSTYDPSNPSSSNGTTTTAAK